MDVAFPRFTTGNAVHQGIPHRCVYAKWTRRENAIANGLLCQDLFRLHSSSHFARFSVMWATSTKKIRADQNGFASTHPPVATSAFSIWTRIRTHTVDAPTN
ncbi:hypothetical protein FI667_g2989, partial [Globisporangium splendens]